MRRQYHNSIGLTRRAMSIAVLIVTNLLIILHSGGYAETNLPDQASREADSANTGALLAIAVDTSASFGNLSNSLNLLANLAQKGIRPGDAVILLTFHGYSPPKTEVWFCRTIAGVSDRSELLQAIQQIGTAGGNGTDPVAGINELMKQVATATSGMSLSPRLWLFFTDAYADAGTYGRAPLGDINFSAFSKEDEIRLFFYDNGRDTDLITRLTKKSLKHAEFSAGISQQECRQLINQLAKRPELQGWTEVKPPTIVGKVAHPQATAEGKETPKRPLSALALLVGIGVASIGLFGLKHKITVDDAGRLLRAFPSERIRIMGPELSGSDRDIVLPATELAGDILTELQSGLSGVKVNCPEAGCTVTVNDISAPTSLQPGSNNLVYSRLSAGIPLSYTVAVELGDFTSLNQGKIVLLAVGFLISIASASWLIWLISHSVK
jgi:hypothetical protein